MGRKQRPVRWSAERALMRAWLLSETIRCGGGRTHANRPESSRSRKGWVVLSIVVYGTGRSLIRGVVRDSAVSGRWARQRRYPHPSVIHGGRSPEKVDGDGDGDVLVVRYLPRRILSLKPSFPCSASASHAPRALVPLRPASHSFHRVPRSSLCASRLVLLRPHVPISQLPPHRLRLVARVPRSSLCPLLAPPASCFALGSRRR
jgi:hypothetical protein